MLDAQDAFETRKEIVQNAHSNVVPHGLRLRNHLAQPDAIILRQRRPYRFLVGSLCRHRHPPLDGNVQRSGLP